MDMLECIPRRGDIVAGKYLVEEVLGQGGMGVVVAARHTVLRQRVAVKFLLPAAASFAGATARFLREAQAVVALQSEHVARVYDVGTLENGAPYMVMEYLAGSDLGRLLAHRGTFPIDEAIDYVLQASEAIAEAHALGIVHRDIKPANLFLTRRPEGSPLVKVLDFGISKVLLPDDALQDYPLTATNVVAGSPHYMSPEQVRSLKHVDERTDIWAIGVTLYELLTGKRPFNGPTPAAICASVAADTPPTPRHFRPDLPAELERFILQCLEKQPERRVPSLAALACGLQPFSAPRSTPSIDHICRILAPQNSESMSTTVPLLQRPRPADQSPDNIPVASAASPANEDARAISTQVSPNSTVPGALALQVNQGQRSFNTQQHGFKRLTATIATSAGVIILVVLAMYWYLRPPQQGAATHSAESDSSPSVVATSTATTSMLPAASDDPINPATPTTATARSSSVPSALTTTTRRPASSSAVSTSTPTVPPPVGSASLGKGIVRERK